MKVKKVTIYSTTTCPYCVMLKGWLEGKKIEFTEYLVDYNRIAADNMVRLSGQMSVPFSTIEYADGSTEKIVGFDRGRFESALKDYKPEHPTADEPKPPRRLKK